MRIPNKIFLFLMACLSTISCEDKVDRENVIKPARQKTGDEFTKRKDSKWADQRPSERNFTNDDSPFNVGFVESMRMVDGESPEEFWRKLMLERDDLSDDELSRVNYLAECLEIKKDYGRFKLFSFLLPLLQKPSSRLAVIEKIEESNLDDATECFSVLVEDEPGVKDYLSEFVGSKKNRSVKKKFSMAFFKSLLDKRKPRDIRNVVTSLGHDDVEVTNNWNLVLTQLRDGLQTGMESDKKEYDPNFLGLLAEEMPGSQALELKVIAAAAGLDSFTLGSIQDLAESLEVAPEKIIDEAAKNRTFLSKLPADHTLELLNFYSVDSSSYSSASTVNAVVSKALDGQSATEFSSSASKLPKSSQEAVLQQAGVRLIVDSGRSEAYKFAEQLAQAQRQDFVSGVELGWEESAESGPTIEEFRSLAK